MCACVLTLHGSLTLFPRSALVLLSADAGKAGKKGEDVDPAEWRCLVRAVGGKQKISTMLAAKARPPSPPHRPAFRVRRDAPPDCALLNRTTFDGAVNRAAFNRTTVT